MSAEPADLGHPDDWNRGFRGGEDHYWLRYPHQLVRRLQDDRRPRQMTILDVGCATGGVSLWLAGRDERFRVIGIDRDPALLEAAEANARRAGVEITTAQGDAAHRLPADDGSVDGVVVHRLRDSLVLAEQRTTIIEEARRVLRPGGYVSLMEDMRVEPGDTHGEWYERRYRIQRSVIEALVRRGYVPHVYAAWLQEPGCALLMSLRTLDGKKLDETTFEGREADLAAEISAGRILVRGIGIHESKVRVDAAFAARGLQAVRRWQVHIPEPPPRHPHATVIHGVLFRRV